MQFLVIKPKSDEARRVHGLQKDQEYAAFSVHVLTLEEPRIGVLPQIFFLVINDDDHLVAVPAMDCTCQLKTPDITPGLLNLMPGPGGPPRGLRQ